MTRATRVLTSTGELEAAVEAARSNGRVGLDTEFMRERTYRARLCLVQLATNQGVAIVDPLDNVDLAPVAALIADPSVQVIVHAGKQDFEIFYERFQVVPKNVFDVQIAAGFVGEGASLPYGRLVQAVLGRMLVKGESYTDWCRRPLTQAQLTYAADDVAYLLEAAQILKGRLRERNRLEWARQEMSSLEMKRAYVVDPANAWRRVAGRGSLPPNRLGVLQAVASWREETARRRDLPRGWIVKDPTLIEIARRAPKEINSLKGIRGLSPSQVERFGEALLEAVRRGRAITITEERPPPRPALTRARLLSGLADAVVRARCEQAGVATELVATRGELEAVLAEVATGHVRSDGHRILTGWRRELAGEAVLELAEGRIAVRSISRPPYIEEVPYPGDG